MNMKKSLESKYTLAFVVIVAITCWLIIGWQYSEVHKDVDMESPTVNDISILLYYYNEKEAQETGNYCSEEVVLPVSRKIPVTNRIIEDTIITLIRGEMTKEEKEQGFSIRFSNPGFKLETFLLKEGVLTLKFSGVPEFKNDISCSADMLKVQIEKTAKQFPIVKEVIIEPEHLFQ